MVWGLPAGSRTSSQASRAGRYPHIHDLLLTRDRQTGILSTQFIQIWLVALIGFLVMAEMGCLSAQDTATADPSGVRNVVTLDESRLNESSGLAVSRRVENHFWTHNDSGSKARLYAFDSTGRKTGMIRLQSVPAIDWEDMASFTDQSVARLLIADCGDNNALRSSVALHLFDEPNPIAPKDPKRIQTITVAYPDGPRDCEAVAVDEHRRQILLVSKHLLPTAGSYEVPLPVRESKSTSEAVTAKRIGTLPLPMVTAMDVQQESGDIWIVSYFQAFCFANTNRDSLLSKQLGRLPQPFELPRWKQIEAVAVDAARNTWLTSEGSPAQLGRLPPPKNDSR